jgi:hypothetical protein
MDKTDLAQDRERWRALINPVKNSWVAQYVGNFLNN